jgi:hypothetical protein
MMAMTWAAGDSQVEKFETARGFYVACHEGRRRPGATLQGFQKALSRVPLRQLRVLAAGVRHEIRARFAARLLVDGFEPMGCDGSRVECPRSEELEKRLGQANKNDSAPTIWVTAFVHLGTGLLWSWQLGRGDGDERLHLRRLLHTLSPQALIVCDAAYMGYELARALIQAHRSFLFRMSSKIDLYTMEHAAIEKWDEGIVYYWPAYKREKGKPPVTCRLIRVPASGNAKRDVWLLTDILDPARLSAQTAAKFYRWRWRNEGAFRIYKRTINKTKLSSRTVRLVHREAELSLLALQIFLAHAEFALRSQRTADGASAISPRKVLIEIRREMSEKPNSRRVSYSKRLQRCRADSRIQSSPKARRDWPRRKPHEPPKPPKLHTLDAELKALLNQHMPAIP